jgi:hypothetical protein
MSKLFEHLKKGLEEISAYKRGKLNEKALRKTIIEIPDEPKNKKIKLRSSCCVNNLGT